MAELVMLFRKEMNIINGCADVQLPFMHTHFNLATACPNQWRDLVTF
jgi:hypothetical protein